MTGKFSDDFFSAILVHLYHTENKAEHKNRADENNEIGSEKCHNKIKRIIQPVGRNQDMNPEKKKKTAPCNEKRLPYPPE